MEQFYDRTKELAALNQIDQQSKEYACFTLLTGRRRIGKTELLRHFIQNKKSAYLFTIRDSQGALCSQWQRILAESIGLKIFGAVTELADLFEQILLFSQDNHFVLVIDEFQDLQFIVPSFFSRMQQLWDTHKAKSKINLIVCGSVYSMMTRIFQDSKEPL
ncbi:MAG: ATP-binding protein, partial [Spirochaetaceae bacterium]|nr:ATP-binding protein [Spirochaetaceae bacterium]